MVALLVIVVIDVDPAINGPATATQIQINFRETTVQRVLVDSPSVLTQQCANHLVMRLKHVLAFLIPDILGEEVPINLHGMY